MNKVLNLIFFITILQSAPVEAQNYWKKIKESEISLRNGSTREIIPTRYQTFRVDLPALKSHLKNAPLELNGSRSVSEFKVEMPDSEGNMETFVVYEAPSMEPGLAEKFPDIKSYKGYSTHSKLSQIRFAVSERGIHAVINAAKGEVYIDPYATQNATEHIVYYTKDYIDDSYKNINLCGLEDAGNPERQHFRPPGTRSAPAVEIRVYRAAVACTGEWGARRGTVAACIADINAMITRLNMIYEKDLAVRFVLITDNDKLIHLDGATDPYDTPTEGLKLVGVNTGKLNAIISSSAYDIGHVLSTCTDVGGVAQISSLCQSNKGNGVTCHRSESISVVVTRIVAHEIGHQFNASHSWNNCPSSATQRSPGTAFEPGSGSTIMSYAGACGVDNVIADNEDYFHVGSLEQMFSKTLSTGNAYGCAQKIITTNRVPVITMPTKTYTIPVLTPFEIQASATDEDNDALTYTWEQYDTGSVTTLGTASETGPLFRSFRPSTTGDVRFFPRASSITSGIFNEKNEVLPNTSRNMSFQFTVRDNNPLGGGVVWDDYSVKVDALAGPFKITYPAVDVRFKVGEIVNVTWDVAGTNVAPVNCKNVNIYGSFNGELRTGSSNLIPLALNVPNDGAHDVIIPNRTSSFFRIVIKAADNIFLTTGSLPSRIEQPTVPGIFFEPTVNEITICQPNTGIVNFSTTGLFGYTGDISFQIASTLPAGVTATFDFAQVKAGNPNVLKINSSNISGDISVPLVIKALAPGIAPLERTITVNLKSNDLNNILTKAPQDGVSGVSSTPQFIWDKKVDALQYELQISTNPSFETTQIVFSKISVDATIKSETILNKSNIYYWRVRGLNSCGAGEWTPIRAFMTEALACKTYNSGLQSINISASGSPTVEIPLLVSEDGSAVDINIKLIRGEHNRLVDLEGFLIAPSGKSVTLWSRKCGTQKNLNLGLDDQAPETFQCPINTGKIYQPENPLASLHNESIKGTWRLQLADRQSGEGGRLQEFNLELCSNLTVSSPFIVKNEVLKLFPGNNKIITDTLLLTSDNNNTANQLVYTIVTLQKNGKIFINGVEAKVGSTFTQADLNAAKVLFDDILNEEGNDFFTFTVNDGQGGWISITRFEIQKSKSFINSISDLNLENDIDLYPNPAWQMMTITTKGKASDFNQYEIVDVTGRTFQKGPLTDSTTLVNVENIPSGIYLIQLKNGILKVSKRLIKY
jgi:subtilisin-like proprotein convertase family protein